MGYDAPLPFVPGSWVPASVSGYGAGPAGMMVGVRGIRGGSRRPYGLDGGRGVVGGLSGPRITRIFADGIRCAAPICPRVLDSRLRGKDGGCGNDGLFTLTPGSSPGQALVLSRRGTFAQLDVGAVARPNRPRVPVCPTPWIPAYAGMTVVVESTHRGRGGFNCLLCFSLDSRLRGKDGLFTLTLGPPS